MSERQSHLTELHALDRARQAVLAAQKLVEVDQRPFREVAQLSARRHNLAQQLKRDREQASDLDWELAEAELRIQTLTDDQAPPSDSFVADELATLRKRRDALEDEVLQQLEAIEAAEQEQRLIEAAWQSRPQLASERQATIEAEAKRLADELATIDRARQALLAKLTDEERAAYQGLTD